MAQLHFATQPGIGPQHTYCKYSGHGTSCKEQEEGFLAYNKTCRRCIIPAHFRAACRSTARAYATSNENPDYEKANPKEVGTLPTNGPSQPFNRGHNC